MVFYSEPHYEFSLPNTASFKGTLHSTKCRRIADTGVFENNTCSNCRDIRTLNTFKCKVYKIYKRSTNSKCKSMHYCDLTKQELVTMARKLRSTVKKQHNHMFFKDCKITRLSTSKTKLKSKVTQLCKEGCFGPA